MAPEKSADRLPTEEERSKLGEIIAFAFHNLPREMYGWGNFDWRITRGMMQSYEEKWPDAPRKYTAMLDRIHPVLECT